METITFFQSKSNHILKNLILASILLKFSHNVNYEIERKHLFQFINENFPMINLDYNYFCNLVNYFSKQQLVSTEKKSILPLDSNFFKLLIETKLPKNFFKSVKEIVEFCYSFDITKFKLSFWDAIFGCNTKVINFHKDFTDPYQGKPPYQYSKLQINPTTKFQKRMGKYMLQKFLKNLLIDNPFVIRLSIFNIVKEKSKLVKLTDHGKKFWILLDSYFNYCDLIDELLFKKEHPISTPNIIFT
ncbi:MAG: hypothetical protein HeimC2_13780 [Candidatus Heimdallarchaeota archaeon LC_2]|nr:MAG: hypothetical protein HeimC2_13780 [Candidatus Heimdallarchaeota archaeon LC_2]